MIDIEAAARNEVEHELVALGLHPTSVDLVSPLGPRKGMRFAYRVVTADGQTVKARHLGTAQDADRLRALRCHLDPAFAPVLDQSGAVLVEEWVDGTPLCELDSTQWFEPAGALLGRLHHSRPDAGATATRSWTESARADLALLEEAEELTAAEAAALRERLHATDPGTARLGLLHKDFCADNFVIDTAGALRVIDNELLAIDPIGFDFGRTFHLWPMDDDAWSAFHQGYASAGLPPPDASAYWRIVAALVGGRVFLTRSRVRLEETVRLLLRFGDGELLQPP
jgi:hypothetical protein